MLLVPTFVAISPIQGLGLFAREGIRKEAVIRRFVAGIDLILELNQIAGLPEVPRQFCLRYAARDPRFGRYILAVDDGRFINHSEDPNTKGLYPAEDGLGVDVAIRDIARGEEITCDYRTFDTEADFKLAMPVPIKDG